MPSVGRWVLGGVGCAAVAATLTSCGAATSPGTYVGDNAVSAVAEELEAEGAVAYFLGASAAGLNLTHVARVTENGPDFQVFTSYGTCRPAMFEEGGCMDPLMVDTMAWRPDLTGVSCQRLDPQLGVPAGLIMGELTLFTERLQVRVLHADDLADYDGHRGLALLDQLRPVGESRPIGSLPPPEPEVARWVDEFCGTVPGEVVDHPMEDASEPLDNTPCRTARGTTRPATGPDGSALGSASAPSTVPDLRRVLVHRRCAGQ